MYIQTYHINGTVTAAGSRGSWAAASDAQRLESAIIKALELTENLDEENFTTLNEARQILVGALYGR
jgi:hypothetical protein